MYSRQAVAPRVTWAQAAPNRHILVAILETEVYVCTGIAAKTGQAATTKGCKVAQTSKVVFPGWQRTASLRHQHSSSVSGVQALALQPVVYLERFQHKLSEPQRHS